MDVALNGTKIGRIEYVLFVKESPRAAENMRLLCSGGWVGLERGEDAAVPWAAVQVGTLD